MSEGREPPEWIIAAQSRWADAIRPKNIVTPSAGQESVWDYPRPPRLESEARPVTVMLGEQVVAQTSRAMRICETASPPTYYVPPSDVDAALLVPLERSTICEWKGEAAYFDVEADGQRASAAAWCYPKPFRPFGPVAGWLAFMPALMTACFVGEHRVQPQPGGFYGGWITPELTGPFKGEPGTGHW